jgi:SAM-dependent methyltransferase
MPVDKLELVTMPFFFRIIPLLAFCLIVAGRTCCGQIKGESEYAEFVKWQKAPENSTLAWESAIEKYAAKLKSEGRTEKDIEGTITIISARDEATLYDPIFAKPPKFRTGPNQLLIEAVKNLVPGNALDVGMGQGRNSIYLAQRGWKVTGFDVAKVGLAHAERLASAAGVQIKAVHASDTEFDFGVDRWDLIAIIYPIEKRSVYRVRKALKKGGLVVLECGHKDAGSAPFEYDTNELLRIFEGFRILKYEDVIAEHEWARKELRLVRLIAQK